MERLIDFPLDEDARTAGMRKTWLADGTDSAAVALGLELATAGCSYEAGHLLRPRRKLWKEQDGAERALTALEAQSWWNKFWREFAQARQAGRHDNALSMLGGRAVQFWDMPPVLMHLGAVAMSRDQLDLAEHIFRRVGRLAANGLPKMAMDSFAYACEAALIDALTARGKFDDALAAYSAVVPNSGNAMAHQLQGARLAAVAGQDDQAMRRAAEIVVTAEKERKGWSRDFRLDFIDKDPALDGLRTRGDWAAMRTDPKGWLADAG